ncbi:hypothetical protein [Paraburkholderia phosphatilytica]|nr:hypothetical protein [Paraburkholderia phosphatilytica]
MGDEPAQLRDDDDDIAASARQDDRKLDRTWVRRCTRAPDFV